jgi:drug/metabolite transporter (DMT)-like permease
LAASGIVGLAIGDSALFTAFTTIGPRRGMMMMASAPLFTVVVAWILLDEHLGPRSLLGIAIVIGGVLLAVAGREKGGGEFGGLSAARLRHGYLLGLVAAAGQGLGSAFAKLGMAEIDPLSATLVRMVWAALAAALIILPRQVGRLRSRLQDRKGLLALGGAVLLGPFISVWISLVALKNADAGVAQVLLGLVPIFVILPAWLVYRDRPSVQSLIGVIVAAAGGAVLFLR